MFLYQTLIDKTILLCYITSRIFHGGYYLMESDDGDYANSQNTTAYNFCSAYSRSA